MSQKPIPMLWFERVFDALGVPYTAGVFGVVFLPHALLLIVGPIAVGYGRLGGLNSLGLVATLLVDVVILLYGTRFMKIRLEELGAYTQSQLLPDEVVSTVKLYGLRAQLGTFLLFTAVIAPPLIFNGALPFPVVLVDLPGWIYFSAYFSTFVWVYSYSMYEIYRLGKLPLKLRPFTEDRTLGLRPFGRVSMQFSAVYFALVMGSFIPQSLVYFTTFPVPNLVGLISGFSVVGILLFLIPLLSLRPPLKRAKARDSEWIGRQYTELVDQMKANPHPSREDEILYSSRLASIDKLQRDIRQIRTWPFDIQILERFLAIIVSVTAITIANVIKLIL